MFVDHLGCVVRLFRVIERVMTSLSHRFYGAWSRVIPTIETQHASNIDINIIRHLETITGHVKTWQCVIVSLCHCPGGVSRTVGTTHL